MVLPLDILTALAAMMAGAVVLFALGFVIARHCGGFVSGVLMLLAVATLITWAVWLNDNPLLARLIPHPDVMIYGNAQLPAAFLLAGVASTRMYGPRWQRVLLVVALLGIGVYRFITPLLGSAPPCGPDRWTDGVCRQSSTSSCSAAAAATVLKSHGIPASEREMIDLCLTRNQGTTVLGVYRGLRLKTIGTSWRVWVSDERLSTIDQWPLPAIITIKGSGVGAGGGIFNISPGHDVVLFSRLSGNRYAIGDPFTGRQTWTRSQITAVYAGQVATIVK